MLCILLYVDESGNTGLDLTSAEQPIFTLCAMVLPESKWLSVEQELKAALDARIPAWRRIDGFEVHAADLRIGRGQFSGMSCADRIAFRESWMNVGARHEIKLIHRTVAKAPYGRWLVKTFGSGVMFNPHVIAFSLLARCVDTYLQSLPDKPLGMFISDDNKEIVADVEKVSRVLKDEIGPMRTSQLIEKGFFIDSSKSLPLQLCDLYALSLRKRTERIRGLGNPKRFDDTGITTAESLLHKDQTQDGDVLDWFKQFHAAQKMSGQGITPRVD